MSGNLSAKSMSNGGPFCMDLKCSLSKPASTTNSAAISCGHNLVRYFLLLDELLMLQVLRSKKRTSC